MAVRLLALVLLAAGTASAQIRSPMDRFGEQVDVKDFGAVGDGVADDTAAFQAAVTAAAKGGALTKRAVVVLPAGDYRVSRTITGDRLMLRADLPNSHVRVFWDGPEGGDAFVNTGIGYSNFGLVEGINFRDGASRPGRWVKLEGGIDNHFIFHRVAFQGSTVAAVEVQDFVNFFVTEVRFDPFSGWGILINEDPASYLPTTSFCLDRFTFDAGGDDGANPVAAGLLKTAGEPVRRGTFRISNGRIEMNGPMAEPKAAVVVEGLLESRGGRFVFDTIEVDGDTYGTDYALLRYLPANPAISANYGPEALFVNVRYDPARPITYWYRDETAAGSLLTNEALGPLFAAPSATVAALPAEVVLQGMEWSGAGNERNDPKLILRRRVNAAGGGVGAQLEQTATTATFYRIPDLTVPGTKATAWTVGGSGANATIGFLGATPIARPTITGSRGGNAALAGLLTQLAALGLIVDGTDP